MRLGAYDANIKGKLLLIRLTKKKISERHRHRYEVNPDFIKNWKKKGLFFPVNPAKTPYGNR